MNNKKLIVLIASACAVVGIAFIVLVIGMISFVKKHNGIGGNVASADEVSRYEWIKELCETFELEEPQNFEQFFKDVDSASEYYPFVQTSAYWDVAEGDSFGGEKAVTGEYAAITACKAIGKYKLMIYTEADEFLSDNDYVELAIENGILDKAKTDSALTHDECTAILGKARDLSKTDLWKDDYEKIEWQDGVRVFESADDLQFDDSGDYLSVGGVKDKLSTGDIIVFPNELGIKTIRKIEKENEDGTYTLAEGSIDEACKSAVISDRKELTFADMFGDVAYWDSGSAGKPIDGLDYNDAKTVTLGTKKYNDRSKGFKIEVSATDNDSLEIVIHDNDTNAEFKTKVSVPDKGEGFNLGAKASLNVDEIVLCGQIDYEGLDIQYLDIDANVHSTIEGEVNMQYSYSEEGNTEDVKLPGDIAVPEGDYEKIYEKFGDKIGRTSIEVPLWDGCVVLEGGGFYIKCRPYIVIEASGGIRFKVDVPAEFETIYEKGKGFRKNFSVKPEQPEIILNAEADIAFRPELIPGIFCLDIIDIDAQIGAHAEGKATVRPNEDLFMCLDLKASVPTFSLGVGLDDSGKFMLLKNDLTKEMFDISVKWDILDKDNAPIQLNKHYESRISGKELFVEVPKCTYGISGDIPETYDDDELLKSIKSTLNTYGYPFINSFELILDKDYSEYGSESSWRDCGSYYEVDGYIKLPTAFVIAGSRNSGNDGSSDLENATINMLDRQIFTVDGQTLNRNKTVLNGLETVDGTGKAIMVKSIDDSSEWDVCFFYGPSKRPLEPHYYERYHNLPVTVEEESSQYYWELCEAYYEDTDGNLSDRTGAWFLRDFDIPTISDKRVTVKVKKDAVLAIDTEENRNPDEVYMVTMQDIYENKASMKGINWDFYEWFKPNEYGWSSMCRTIIVFAEDGMVKELVPMSNND